MQNDAVTVTDGRADDPASRLIDTEAWISPGIAACPQKNQKHNTEQPYSMTGTSIHCHDLTPLLNKQLSFYLFRPGNPVEVVGRGFGFDHTARRILNQEGIFFGVRVT